MQRSPKHLESEETRSPYNHFLLKLLVELAFGEAEVLMSQETADPT